MSLPDVPTQVDDSLCLGRMNNFSGTQCTVDLIFNGARSIKTIVINLDFAAHAESFVEDDEEYHVEVVTTRQVGDGGLKPFMDKLHEMYPNILMVPDAAFDELVAAQKDAAEKLI